MKQHWIVLFLTIFYHAPHAWAQSITITPSAAEYCAGKPVTITAVATNAGVNASYQWMLNEKPFSNNNSLVFSNDTLKHGDLVYCLVQPGSGAANTTPIASNKISLVINALPVVDVFPADTIIRVGNTVVFRVFVAGNVDNGEWTPANKMKDIQLPAPSTVTLYETTAYTLKVKTNKGCEAFSDAQVQVTKPMVMPTGFTPNGDGANDVFRIPPGIIFELKEFSVYDRWGAQLFFTRNRKNGWDGTFRGKQACPGEYVYMVSAKNDKGSFILKGKVTLLR